MQSAVLHQCLLESREIATVEYSGNAHGYIIANVAIIRRIYSCYLYTHT